MVAQGFPTVLSFNVSYRFVWIMDPFNTSEGSFMTCAQGISVCLIKYAGGDGCICMKTQR